MSSTSRFRFSSVAERRPRIEAIEQIDFETSLIEPQADVDAIIAEAMEAFLSRHKVDCPVAIQLPGQSGLLRFLKIPPVAQDKLPDIMRYEARQQIPFALDDVEWRATRIDSGAADEQGYAIESEMMLTAVKREQLQRLLTPYLNSFLEPDLIQLQPLTLVNYLWSTSLGHRPADGYVVAIETGANTTTLVITNGTKIWQRSIPIGGSHFTRCLTKEMKLTFSKAEALKRNAIKADDPKALFLCLRPVFQDLLAEIQRSLGFFLSLERKGDPKLTQVAFFGSAFKLPGLKLYIKKALELPELEVDPRSFLEGAIVNDPHFQEAYPSLVTAVNLSLERLGIGKHFLNLMPRPRSFADVLRKLVKTLSLGRVRLRTPLPTGQRLIKTNSAWGIDIGSTGLRAVCISVPA